MLRDIQETHIILNAKSGHGKSCTLKTIISELKRRYPRTIVKVFDVSQTWFHVAPLEWRQRISIEKMRRITEQGQIDFRNLDDCVYEMGDLTEELRRFFVAIIIKQDYEVRREMGYRFGKEAVEKLPKIIYVFEEADTYFDSTSLNKKDEASALLRDFIKVGRNFGLRAFCVVTATVGELGTKLRRRSTHLIGRTISDQDLRFYNRKVKRVSKGVKNGVIRTFLDNYDEEGTPPTFGELEKEITGLGNLSLRIPKYHWIYYNGAVSELFMVGDKVRNVPKDFEVKRGSLKQPEVEEPLEVRSKMSTLTKIVLTAIATFILTIILLRL